MGGVDKKLSNVIVILGANNAGKTTLLKDIYSQAVMSTNSSKTKEDSVVWSDVLPDKFFSATKKDYINFFKSLSQVEGQQPVHFFS